MEVGCLRHPGASSIGSQLLDGVNCVFMTFHLILATDEIQSINQNCDLNGLNHMVAYATHETVNKLMNDNQLLLLFQIIHIDPESSEGAIYCIHYAGWNNRYVECSLHILEGTNKRLKKRMMSLMDK